MNWLVNRAALLGLFVISGISCAADIFDDPENLKVLPKDISPAQLRATMRGFSLATGHRCEGCHVGEAGEALETFDFESDKKDTKIKAREMFRLVADINERLSKEFGDQSNGLVEVQCMTCHRGQNKPVMLDDLLVDATAADGLDASIEKYRELRQTYYGSHTFDFGEMTLLSVATRLAGKKDAAAAMAFLDLNLEFNPRSWMTYYSQSELLGRDGNKDAARVKLKKALEIAPDNPFLKRALNESE